LLIYITKKEKLLVAATHFLCIRFTS